MPPPIDPNVGQNQSLLGGVLGSIPLVGGLLSGISQVFTNSRNRRFQKEMYDRQRQDALADWNMQNAYNSPEQQMARLKGAGLNPNLVYGNGVTANNSQQPRSASPSGGTAQAPEFGAGATQSLMLPIDMAIKQQQLENLKVSNAAMLSGIVNKNADTALKTQNTAGSLFKLEMEKTLRETSIATREAFLRNLGVRSELGVSQTGLNLLSMDIKQKYGYDTAAQNLANLGQTNALREAANARAESTNIADLKIKAQQVLNMMRDNTKSMQEYINLQEAAKGIRRSNTLKELDIWMRQAGFNWTDPVILRQLRFGSRGYSK